MGFECVYHFHEKLEGDYNKEEVKTFKKKVGDPFEEVSLEKLAGAVMAQLARRDVWIVDVEIFELSKKQISFKEAKGGIVLKNKKFLFDGGGAESSTIIVEDMMQNQAPTSYPQTASVQHPHEQVQQNVNISNQSPNQHPHNQGLRRPVDWVLFTPELHQMVEVKQKNLRFTPDKKYPVFEKKPSPMGPAFGDVFTMVDDTGREQLVSDKYFVPGNTQLFADELGFSETSQQRDGGKLYWGSANQEPDMPDIRRR
jgi:hypothetical protein